jgi:hypothetical protein
MPAVPQPSTVRAYFAERAGRTGANYTRVIPRVLPIKVLTSRGPLAQLAEQRTFNPRVVGSSPTGPTNQQVSGLHLAVVTL